jgi:hypothetical protein
MDTTTPAKVKKQRKRPSYDENKVEEILALLREGKSLHEICLMEGMPKRTTVIGWIDNDFNGLADKYARARDIGYMWHAEKMMEIADTPHIMRFQNVTDNGATQTVTVVERDMTEHRKLQIDTRKWILARMLPKQFGDKNPVDDNNGELKITIEGGTGRITRKNGRDQG